MHKENLILTLIGIGCALIIIGFWYYQRPYPTAPLQSPRMGLHSGTSGPSNANTPPVRYRSVQQ